MELFGFEIKSKRKIDNSAESVVSKPNDDGASIITAAAGGSYGTYVDLDATIGAEANLITKYRDAAHHHEVDAAIDEIVNEAMDNNQNQIVKIDFRDGSNISENVKNTIIEEFKTCTELLAIDKYSYDIFKKWYIDGKLTYHVIIDRAAPKDGIKELRYIDPRKIRKIREVGRSKSNTAPGSSMNHITIEKVVNEYFLYNEKGFDSQSQKNSQGTYSPTGGIKIATDSIVYITSGLTDSSGKSVLSYLHKALKAINQLRTLEDALVIYRLARAPERRVWYIDVGNLPKMKAEQYLREVMVKHKNKLVYDAATGNIRDDRKFMTMLEDYWLPRRDGGKGTEVTTLPGGQNLGQLDDVVYFQKQLYRSLGVPITRLDSEGTFNFGKAAEISRDEVKFSKFVDRLRSNFSDIFMQILEKQLILKGVFTYEEWLEIAPDIQFIFTKDNHFQELKENEVLSSKLDTINKMQPYIGQIWSYDWIMKKILNYDEMTIGELKKSMKEEAAAQEKLLAAQQSQDQNADPDADPNADPNAEQQNFPNQK